MSTINGIQFEQAIKTAAIQYLQVSLSRMAPQILMEIKDIVRLAVLNSPEHGSLLAGDLRNLFGIQDPAPVVQSIVDAVTNSVRVVILPASGLSLGGIRVNILLADMSEVLNLPGSSYLSRSLQRGTEILVPWLNWLLLVGDQVVIADFEVKTDKPGFTGTRTGKAVMVRPKKRPSQGFRVPPHFSGTVDNNWLTRVLEGATGQIVTVLEKAFRRL
jgi:hypothetical protein